MQRFPRSMRPKPYIRLPSLELLHWEDKTPRKFDFESQWVGNRDSSLKRNKTPHAPWHREEAVIWKESREDLSAGLEEFLGKAGGKWSLPAGHRHWQQPLWEACSTMWAPVLASAIWNPLSSLSGSGPSPTHTQQLIDTSTGMTQANQQGGTQSHWLAEAVPRNPEPTATPGHGLVLQRPQEQPTYTRAQTLDLRPCSQKPWAMIHPQWAGTNPGIPSLTQYKPAVALRLAVSTTGWISAPG